MEAEWSAPRGVVTRRAHPSKGGVAKRQVYGGYAMTAALPNDWDADRFAPL
jgi:hypothetical protein